MINVIMLCSGRGLRMRPLSDKYPKSLIPVSPSVSKSRDCDMIPNLLNTIEVLTESVPYEHLRFIIAASSKYFESPSYLGMDLSEYRITKVVVEDSVWNNSLTLERVLVEKKVSTLDNPCPTIIVEGDVYLRSGFIDICKGMNLCKFFLSHDFCTYRDSEWVYVSCDNESGSHTTVLKDASGLSMSGVTVLTHEDLYSVYKKIKYHHINHDQYWNEAIIELLDESYDSEFTMVVDDFGDTIVEFDSISDLIKLGMYSHDQIARLLDDDGHLARTSSMTNYTYFIKFKGNLKVLKFPGPGTDTFINRTRTDSVNKLLEEVGLPSVSKYPCNISLSEFVPGDPMTCLKDLDSYDKVEDLVRSLEEFHDKVSGTSPLRRIKRLPELLIDFISEINKYESLYSVQTPPNYKEVSEFYKKILSRQQHQSVTFCQVDLDPRNIIVDEERKISFIDHEYSGFVNKYWDAGSLLSELMLYFDSQESSELCHNLLRAFGKYFYDVSLVVLWSGVVDFVWSCWSFAKISSGESDLEDYANERWRAACMIKEEFESTLDQLWLRL